MSTCKITVTIEIPLYEENGIKHISCRKASDELEVDMRDFLISPEHTVRACVEIMAPRLGEKFKLGEAG